MMSTTISTCLTVEEFFTHANWRGLKIQTPPSQSELEIITIDNTETPKLNLSVENFFGRSNWRGLKQVTTRTVARGEGESIDYKGIMPPLTATVTEFFQRIVWLGQKMPKIAKLPEVKQPKRQEPQPESLNINDLSDLF